ncbi:lipase 1-like [Condylostylus longicornis]|uniref:lipase 1-like n=1 Tax=Condylostylus longicornis TaxID=2530218 RepID=UPI00244E0783|nr:lipase 1-like [Condylostylus longicornis]
MVTMKSFLTTCVVLLIISNNFVDCISKRNILEDDQELEHDPDAFLLVPEIIEKYGYPVERHNITTEDGFILQVHRIPRPGAIPVFLQHGLLASSAEWIVMGPEKGLGYYLYQLGYDVWMGNMRGNRYSRNHIKFNANDKEFWDFSFHELGYYDLPAMIDHIIKVTEHKRIHYIGHSQGTTSFWAMCALRAEYCDKIIGMQALAPVAYLDNAKCPLIVALAPLTNSIETITKLLGKYEFLPNNELMALAGQALCKDQAITQVMCTNIVFLIAGYDSDQLNKSSLPVFLGHFPAGASSKQLIHFGQIRKQGKYQLYDYGFIGNLLKYKSIKPPLYDLNKVTAPVVLHYSQNDWLADSLDVLRLKDELPNVIRTHIVANPKFNHLDFLTAIDIKKLLYDDVVNMLKEFEQLRMK